VKSIAELTALARKNPGKLGFGEGSASSRASVEMYKEMAGIDFLRVPYKSNPQAVTDLVSGQVVLMIADMVTLLPQVKAGKLRALAVSTPARLAILPDLPTMNEAGVKGYELTVWFAGFMPSGSPADAIRRMAELFGGATKTTKMQEFFVNFGGSAQSSSPEELSRFVASETAKWARIVKPRAPGRARRRSARRSAPRSSATGCWCCAHGRRPSSSLPPAKPPCASSTPARHRLNWRRRSDTPAHPPRRRPLAARRSGACCAPMTAVTPSARSRPLPHWVRCCAN